MWYRNHVYESCIWIMYMTQIECSRWIIQHIVYESCVWIMCTNHVYELCVWTIQKSDNVLWEFIVTVDADVMYASIDANNRVCIGGTRGHGRLAERKPCIKRHSKWNAPWRRGEINGGNRRRHCLSKRTEIRVWREGLAHPSWRVGTIGIARDGIDARGWAGHCQGTRGDTAAARGSVVARRANDGVVGQKGSHWDRFTWRTNHSATRRPKRRCRGRGTRRKGASPRHGLISINTINMSIVALLSGGFSINRFIYFFNRIKYNTDVSCSRVSLKQIHSHQIRDRCWSTYRFLPFLLSIHRFSFCTMTFPFVQCHFLLLHAGVS